MLYLICLTGSIVGLVYALSENSDMALRLIGTALIAMSGIAASLNFDYAQPMNKMSAVCRHAGYVEARLYDDGVVSCAGMHDTKLYGAVLAEYNEYIGEGDD